jgi:hypothetical protein
LAARSILAEGHADRELLSSVVANGVGGVVLLGVADDGTVIGSTHGIYVIK